MKPFTHNECLGTRGVKKFKCEKCGLVEYNYTNGINVCHKCCIKHSICEICGKSINKDNNPTEDTKVTKTKTKNYRKGKVFKSELRTYYVEADIFRYYSHDQAKVIIYLYEDNKKVLLSKEEFRISNYYKHTDLDNCVGKVITEFEDWKDLY